MSKKKKKKKKKIKIKLYTKPWQTQLWGSYDASFGGSRLLAADYAREVIYEIANVSNYKFCFFCQGLH